MMTTPVLSSQPPSVGAGTAPDTHAQLRAVARDLETAFLTEMLKHAGFGEARDQNSFGGGIGEEQFSSMLRDEHARAIAARGGIGLAESIFESLARRTETGR